MKTKVDFSVSDPGELEVYAFDFTNHIGPEEQLIGAEWEIEAVEELLWPGFTLDTDASSRLSGAPFVSALPGCERVVLTSQRVEDLRPGNVYRLLARVTTDAGNSPSLWSHVTCEPLT